MFRITALLLISMFSQATIEVLAADLELSEEKLARYCGDFWEATEGFAAEVQVIDGKLWAVHSPDRRNELAPVGPDRFQMLGMPAEVFIDYTMTETGVAEMRRTINGKPSGVFSPFTRRQPDPEDLKEYTGVYFNAATETRYILIITDGRLVFSPAGEDPQELTAMFGDTFESADFGSFTFQRDAAGAISGFRLQSRVVGDLAFDRD